MKLFEEDRYARLYMDKPYIPETWRKKYIDEEIYHIDVKLLHRHKTASGDMWDILIEDKELCIFASCLVPLVYVLSKDSEVLSVHMTTQSAVAAIEEIERVDKNKFGLVHEHLVSEMIYDSKDASYRIEAKEIF